MNHFSILLAALATEAVFGYPQFIYRFIKHPVVWMGAVIVALDKNCNQPNWKDVSRKAAGAVSMLVLISIVIVVCLVIQHFGNWLVEMLCVATLLATRSLYDHVRAVYLPLMQNNLPEKLPEARENLAKIVGRDTENLDADEIAKAAIESLAESFSDGVVAPLFWAACLGLPAIAAYKAINTADSMIGHKTEKYRDFGWAAARLDDCANFIPARLSALIIALAALSLNSLKSAWRDGRKHASPNSGYPEAAMAGALGVALGGKRSYDGIIHSSPIIGAEYQKEITAADLKRAMRVYISACAIIFLVLLYLL